MSHAHHGHAHQGVRHAHAARPTLSLLRWSAGQRVILAAALLAPLWAWVASLLA